MTARISQLTYRYKDSDRDALKGISLEVNPGEVLGLIGPDGAGKTTLLRLLAGLLKPGAGRAEVLGKDTLLHHAELSRMVGYMAQRFSLYEELTVAENMRLAAGVRNVPARQMEADAARLLASAGLAAFADRRAGHLSGGMKQKLALICAMQGDSALLLLDEPCLGVDPVSRRELWALVEQAKMSGKAIIWATSYLDEAARCDRVCILNEGEVIYLGRPGDLLGQIRGRVYSIPCAKEELLPRLLQLQAEETVMDAMIEGAFLRVLLKPGAPAPASGLVEPNFEEAFINLVGGVRQKCHFSAGDEPTPAPLRCAEEVLVTEGLTRRFGDFVATDNLSIRVRRGEIFGILGSNGAGKTTAFRMMCGLIPASSGSASLLGVNLLQNRRKAREMLGYMAQRFSLYAGLTVQQNLNFFSAVYGLRGEIRRQRTAQAVERYELRSYLNTKSGNLPVGIKQRLSMACATLHRPAFLFLDEPTSGVDPFARRYFWEIINEMAAQGVTIIVTTHFMDEAQYLHRMVIMNQGKVIAQGTPEELKLAAASELIPNPTMEDAFIHFTHQYTV